MTQVSINGHKRAVLYARVSTDEQADKGYSLPSQFDAMRKYAAQQGFEIAGEFQDDYSGATPIEFRPEGSKAYTMLKSGAADLIVAFTIDRFVRPPEDGDEWDMPVLIRGLAKLGKEIHTVRRGKLNTNFADLLIALLDARKAGEERRDIRERCMRGKRQKVKSGRVIGLRAPYGYQYTRDENGKVLTLEVDETTARVVRLIYKWYVEGDEHNKRLSDRTIALRLSQMKIVPPGEMQRGYKFRKRGIRVWAYSTVRCILRSEVYAGNWRYGVNHPKREDFTEILSVSVPAIVDRVLWEQAQTQRQRNIEFSPRNKKREYLLGGLIRCGLCNNGFSGMCQHNDRYYRCTYKSIRIQELEGRCANRTMARADAIEADVWDEILELFSDLGALRDKLELAQRQEIETLDPIREKLQITNDLIKHEVSEAAKIAAALPDTKKDSLARKIMLEKDEAINARLKELATQREKYITQLGARNLTDDRVGTIMQFAEDLKKGIDNADYDKKRVTLETLKVKVIITFRKYHIDCILGSKDGEISQMKNRKRIVLNLSRKIHHLRQFGFHHRGLR